MRRALTTGLAVAAWLALLGPSAVAAEGQRRPIVVGGDHENRPYEFLEGGRPTGFNVELIRAVAEVTGMDVQIRLGPWSEARAALERGEVDALAGMYYSPERAALVDFSVPHAMASSAFLVRKDSPFRTFEDLRGKEIVVQRGDALHDLLAKSGFSSRLIPVSDVDGQLRLLASGRHDAAAMLSRVQAEHYLKALGIADLRPIDTGLSPQRYCFAVRKGNRELLHRLDEGLNILKLSGRYQQIYERWFGVYETPYLWRYARHVGLALAALALLAAAGLLWSRSLQRLVRARTAELRQSEEALRSAHAELEQRVEQRTLELRRANEQLETSEAEKALILNSSTDIIHYQDLEFRMHWGNQKAAEVAGVTITELTGRACYQAFHGRTAPCEGCPIPAVRESLQPHSAEVSRPGDRTLLHRAYPVTAEDGRLVGVAAFVTDITPLKQVEERLRHKRQELEELNRTLERRVQQEVAHSRETDLMLFQQNRQAALGETLEHVAHQWKQPLNSISISLWRLQRASREGACDAAFLSSCVERLTAQVTHMSQTLDDFRDFFKPDLKPRQFDVRRMLDRSLVLLGASFEAQRIAVEVDAEGEMLVTSYPNDYAQALLNLLNNARDALVERKVASPRITIRVFREAGKAVTTVSDNAGGIPPEILHQIFEPYFTTKAGGTGLGLYISRSIVGTRLEGALTVRNLPHGAEFRIEFGVAPRRSSAALGPQPTA